MLKRKVRSESDLIDCRALWARDFLIEYKRDGIKIDKLLQFSTVTAYTDRRTLVVVAQTLRSDLNLIPFK